VQPPVGEGAGEEAGNVFTGSVGGAVLLVRWPVAGPAFADGAMTRTRVADSAAMSAETTAARPVVLFMGDNL
jgi:hypothetical protein